MLVSVASSCGGADRLGGLKVAELEPSGPGGDLASLTGRLESRAGCLVVVDDIDGRIVMPVFAEGSVSFEDDQLVIDGRDFAFGDAVSVGGSGIDAADVGESIPAGCDFDTAWLVNPDYSVERV